MESLTTNQTENRGRGTGGQNMSSRKFMPRLEELGSMRLDGVRVLDLSRLLPGPFATQLLADAGAEVIKIENPEHGDYAREMPPFTSNGEGAIFNAVNRGKQSIAIDLKSERGKEVFMRLAETADVIFEQFRPDVVERLGIDYKSVQGHNPSIIYTSLSGFGRGSPHSRRVGHDLNYIGMAGLLDITRPDDDSKPVIPGYPIGDMAGGLFAAFSILGALVSRELSNTEGEHIDISITDVVTSFSQAVSYQAFAGEDPRPGETVLTGGVPWYDVYETADGKYVTLAALEEKFWSEFCTSVGREDLIEVHMTEDPAEQAALHEELTDLFAQHTRKEWEDQLGDVEAMVAPVMTLGETLSSDHAVARELVDREGDVPRVGFPAHSTDSPPETGNETPELGEDTQELLQSVGIDDTEIETLSENGIIR